MIGVVGDGETADRVAEHLRAAGHEVRVGTPEEVAAGDPVAIVAVGAGALAGIVATGGAGPVLPVDAGQGVGSVSTDEAPVAAERLAAGDVETSGLPLLEVAVRGERVRRALRDVLLVRSEPGRISEFGVATGDRRHLFRADGVVVATPAGSHGYAHAVGGPRLAQDVEAVSIIPVAPFALGADVWVVDPAGGIELAVEREEGAVSVLLDGREVRTLAGRATVELTVGGTIEVAHPVVD